MLQLFQDSDPNVRLAQVAMSYGIKVFPCRAADDPFGRVKSPLTRRGYRDAACELNQLSVWARRHPDAMYGLPCAPNRLFAVDADRHGTGDGVATLRALFEHHGFDWSSVPCVRTPNDGIHVFFQRPVDLGKTRGKIDAAIDTRDNGYVILPGSRLLEGRQYLLLNGEPEIFSEYVGRCWLATMPAWLRLIVEHKPAIRASHAVLSMETQKRRLEGMLQKVMTSAEGERNNTLHWAACRGGEAVARGAIGFNDMEALLVKAGLSCGLHEDEARRTVRSGLQGTLSGGSDVR